MPNGAPPTSPPTPAILLAARFLLPIDESAHADAPEWRTAGRWLILWGLATGIVYAAVFRITWRWFGEYQGIRWLPAAAVLIADLGFCGYRLLASVTHLSRRSATVPSNGNGSVALPQLLAVVLVIIVKYAMLLSVPQGISKSGGNPLWLPGGWLRWFHFVYPVVVYRPLILMPLWGRWAMSLATLIGRVSASGSPRLRLMAGGVTLRVIVGQWALLSLITILYCWSSLSDLAGGAAVSIERLFTDLARGAIISIGLMLAAYAASFILARRHGGQNEATVCVAGLAGELAFLSLFLAVINNIYWW
jgi:hypothetical protein